MKYIIVSGGVISGIGKGITTASISLLLQSCGYKVTPIKCENYLNLDAGTINPIEHGDPFLCEDGLEGDMDIGHYEKFLNTNLGKPNFMTMGQIYQTVIDRERKFEYQGEDVEAIPYITDEITMRWKDAGKQSNADIVVIELGGTAGEYQNIFYYEASRILTLKNPGDVIHVHVGYMPTPSHLGEPKTKPIQLSVRTLNSMGIQPDFIVVRSKHEMDKRRKDRFALFCNVSPESIISAPNVSVIYNVPVLLKQQNFHTLLQTALHLPKRKVELSSWEQFVTNVESIEKSDKEITIAIVGKYFTTGEYQLHDSYAALFDAIHHAGWHENYKIKTLWIDAEQVEKQGIKNVIEKLNKPINGMIVPIGWGIRGAEGMIQSAGYARTNKLPYLGLCYGMQLAVVSYARDVLGLKDANTTENNPKTTYPVIHLMPSQKEFMEHRAYGGTMRLGTWDAKLKKNTIAWDAYNEFNQFKDKQKSITSERHRHRYEFNSTFEKQFIQKGMIISAHSQIENLVEIIELSKDVHPFYLGTQGHPEYKSRPLSPHPLFVAFIRECIKRSELSNKSFE